jgi:hypothetical protein
VTDCYLQNVAISTLLEVTNHSQSLALVIEDKMKRYKNSAADGDRPTNCSRDFESHCRENRLLSGILPWEEVGEVEWGSSSQTICLRPVPNTGITD